MFNFERLDILCSWIWPPCEKLWPFEFLECFCCSISSISICDAPESDFRVKSNDHLNFSRASVVQFRASLYVMHLHQTSELKVMTIWISRELSLFNFERPDILYTLIGPLSAKLWPCEFLESFHCSISRVSIYYAPELDLRMKSYDRLNFSRTYVVQFRAFLYVMPLNRNSEWKVMTIWISQDLPIMAHNISRRSKLNKGSSLEIQMVITFHSDVQFRCIIYRDARNWTTEALMKFKWSNFSHGGQI